MKPRMRFFWPLLGFFVVLFPTSSSLYSAQQFVSVSATPDGIAVNYPTLVTITAQIAIDSSLLRDSVNLVSYDVQNRPISVLGRLYDDATHGDQQSGDNIFTTQLQVNQAAPTQLVFKVSAAYKGKLARVLSQSITLDVVRIASAQELQVIESINQQGSNLFSSWSNNLGLATARTMLISWLTQQTFIQAAGLSPDGQTVWVQYKNGLYAALNGGPSGTLGGPTNMTGLVASPIATGSDIESNSVITQTVDAQLKAVSSKWNASSCIHPVSTVKNAEVTLDFMKSLSNYGVISITTHGAMSLWGDPMLLTADRSQSSSNLIDWARLRIWPSFSLKGMPWFVLPKFIEAYNHGFPGSVIFLSVCHSLENQKLSGAFIKSGAQAVFGWAYTVDVGFAGSTVDDLLIQMLDYGKNAGEAYLSLKQIDPHIWPDGSPQGTLKKDGSDDATLSCAAQSSQWPTYQHDSRHSGQGSDVGPQTNDSRMVYSLARTDAAAGEYNSVPYPVVGPTGLVYFTYEAPANSYQWKLTVINADGSLAFEKGPYPGRAHLTPSVGSDGTIFVGTSSVGSGSDLYCFYPDGRLKWVKTLANFYGPTIGPDGTLYLAAVSFYGYGPYQLLALMPEDGSNKWPPYTFISVNGLSEPAFSPNNLIIVAGTDSANKGFISAHDPATGSPVWSVGYPKINNAVGIISAATVAQDGTIYFWATPRLWSVSPDGQTVLSSQPMAGVYASTPAIAPDGSIRLAVSVGADQTPARLFAYSASLQPMWSTDLVGVGPNADLARLYSAFPQVAVDSQGTTYASIYPLGCSSPCLPIPLIFSIDSNGKLKWSAEANYANTIILSGPGRAYAAIFDGVPPYWSWKIYSFEPVLVGNTFDRWRRLFVKPFSFGNSNGLRKLRAKGK